MRASSAAVSRNMGSRNSKSNSSTKSVKNIKNLAITSCNSLINNVPEIVTHHAVRSSVFSSEGSWHHQNNFIHNITSNNSEFNNTNFNRLTRQQSARAVFYSKEKGLKNKDSNKKTLLD